VVEVIGQLPAAQDLLDQEEGQAVGLPAMPAVDVQKSKRAAAGLGKIPKLPVVRSIL
jgi:hypothetical protein